MAFEAHIRACIFPGLFPGVSVCRTAVQGAQQGRQEGCEAALCSSAAAASWRGACFSRGNVVGFLGPHLLPLLLFSQVFHRPSSGAWGSLCLKGNRKGEPLITTSVDLQHVLMEKLNSGIHLTLMSLLISSVMSSLGWLLLQCYNCWVCICKWIVIIQVS